MGILMVAATETVTFSAILTLNLTPTGLTALTANKIF